MAGRNLNFLGLIFVRSALAKWFPHVHEGWSPLAQPDPVAPSCFGATFFSGTGLHFAARALWNCRDTVVAIGFSNERSRRDHVETTGPVLAILWIWYGFRFPLLYDECDSPRSDTNG